MSKNPSPIRNNKGAFGQRPQRPTTARSPHAGLAVSLLFHAALISATYLTWSRMVNVSEESHAVPVDLVTVTRVTNVQAMAPPPPPEPQKIEIPVPQMEPPSLPQFQDVEPAPIPPVPQFKIQPEKKTEQQTSETKQKNNSQDFAALLNKLTAPAKTPPNTKAGPRAVQGIGAANAFGRRETIRLEATRDDEYVILRVDARAPDLTRHPVVRQRLRPIGVDLEHRCALRRWGRLGCAMPNACGDSDGHDGRNREGTTSISHLDPPSSRIFFKRKRSR